MRYSLESRVPIQDIGVTIQDIRGVVQDIGIPFQDTGVVIQDIGISFQDIEEEFQDIRYCRSRYYDIVFKSLHYIMLAVLLLSVL